MKTFHFNLIINLLFLDFYFDLMSTPDDIKRADRFEKTIALIDKLTEEEKEYDIATLYLNLTHKGFIAGQVSVAADEHLRYFQKSIISIHM